MAVNRAISSKVDSIVCGTAQFKLDIYMCVALELFNKFVKPLVSYIQA